MDYLHLMKHRKYIIEKSMCTLHKMSPNIIFLTHFVALLRLSLVLQTLVEILIILNAIKYLLGSPKYLWQNYWHTKIIIKSKLILSWTNLHLVFSFLFLFLSRLLCPGLFLSLVSFFPPLSWPVPPDILLGTT